MAVMLTLQSMTAKYSLIRGRLISPLMLPKTNDSRRYQKCYQYEVLELSEMSFALRNQSLGDNILRCLFYIYIFTDDFLVTSKIE